MILECVPNFSEGRDPRVIGHIASAINSTPGVQLLDVDPDADTNRTVMSFFGRPESVLEGAWRGVQAAVESIDMRRHSGEHPRIGAADVVPFVPWAAPMELCVQLSRELGQRMGAAGLPGWYYARAATSPQRELLHDIRRGQFEGLARKVERMPPDFGPAAPHPTAGATVTGARPLLIAFNINLDTYELAPAQAIAARVREFRSVRREGGVVVERLPGRLKAVRAMGWQAHGYGCSQVTCNLVDWRVTPPHVLYEAVKEEAAALGHRVTGSELVGMIPLGALVEAGSFYGAPADRLVEVAIHELGLRSVKPLDPGAKIIEWALKER